MSWKNVTKNFVKNVSLQQCSVNDSVRHIDKFQDDMFSDGQKEDVKTSVILL